MLRNINLNRELPWTSSKYYIHYEAGNLY